VIFDKKRLLGTLKTFRFQTNLTKSCTLNLVEIEQHITQLMNLPVQSRMDISKLYQGAKQTVELREFATLSTQES
jgi:hypothetical protein